MSEFEGEKEALETLIGIHQAEVGKYQERLDALLESQKPAKVEKPVEKEPEKPKKAPAKKKEEEEKSDDVETSEE